MFCYILDGFLRSVFQVVSFLYCYVDGQFNQTIEFIVFSFEQIFHF